MLKFLLPQDLTHMSPLHMIQFGQAQIGVFLQRRLRHIQAQVVIKATLFLTAMYFILKAINYYNLCSIGKGTWAQKLSTIPHLCFEILKSWIPHNVKLFLTFNPVQVVQIKSFFLQMNWPIPCNEDNVSCKKKNLDSRGGLWHMGREGDPWLVGICPWNFKIGPLQDFEKIR